MARMVKITNIKHNRKYNECSNTNIKHQKQTSNHVDYSCKSAWEE
jgi:hypothetical protein